MSIWRNVLEKVGRRVEFHIGSAQDSVGFLVRTTNSPLKVDTFVGSINLRNTTGAGMERLERLAGGDIGVRCEFHFESDLLAVREFMTRNYGERTPIQISNSEGRCVWYIEGMSQSLGSAHVDDKWIVYSVRLRLAPSDEQPKNQIQWSHSSPGCEPDYSRPLNTHRNNPAWPGFDNRQYTPPEKDKRRGRPTPHQFKGRGDACDICGRIYGDKVHTSFNATPAPPKPKPAPPAERVFRIVEDEEDVS